MGSAFSAGQIQRILIARALYRQPEILFLDESLANLNLSAAMSILGYLKARKITTLYVTHNPALIDFAQHELHIDQNYTD